MVLRSGCKANRKDSWKKKFLSVLLFCFFMMPGAGGTCFGAETSESIFDGKPIRKLSIELPADQKNSLYWQTTAEELILLKKGEPYSSEIFIQTINILSDTGLFASIHVPDPEYFKDGISIVFKLQPFDRIKKINIRGAFPIFRKEILNMMTLYVGDAFKKDDIKEQQIRIISFLKKQGYIDPRVTITAEKDKSDHHYTLTVQIEKGTSLRIAHVVMMGNKAISPSRFNLRTKAWKPFALLSGSVRFVKTDADADVKQIIQVYREKGFADVQVEVQTKPSSKKDEIDVIFTISEGSAYVFLFKGNNRFHDRDLKKEIVIFKEGNTHGFGIKKSLNNMKKKYLEQGFLDIKIATNVIDSLKDNVPVHKVTFEIKEGHQFLVSDLVVKGCIGISQDIVSQQILSGKKRFFGVPVYNKQQLEEDLDAIRVLYLNHGYLQTRVEKSVKIIPADAGKEDSQTRVAIKISIMEGPRTTVGRIRFSGLPQMTEEQALEMVSLKPGSPFRRFMIESDENLVKANVSEKGYPHIKIETIVTFRQNENVADLDFKCDPGPLVRMGQVIYTGNFRTLRSILDDEADLDPFTPLSLNKLLETRSNIINIEALDSVRFRTPGLKEKAPKIDLVAAVQEKIPYYLELGTGYDTRRKIYAKTAVGDHNFLGRNLNLEAGLEISQIGYASSLCLNDPRFLGSKISSAIRVFTEKKEEFNKDFGTRSYGFSQEFSKKIFNEKLSLGLGTTYRFHEQFATTGTLPVSQDHEAYEKRGIIMLSPSLIFRTTDSYVRPQKGIVTTANIDISNGFDNDLDDFIKYRFDLRYYFTPIRPLTLALRGKYGLIQSYGTTEDVPEDQLFFLGGTSSVRGFDENLLRFNAENSAVGGKQVLSGSVEARLDIGKNLELAVFFDSGSVSRAADSSGSDRFRSSVGGGIRYITPIGPISLLYGHKLSPESGESSGSFHFSMGYSF